MSSLPSAVAALVQLARGGGDDPSVAAAMRAIGGELPRASAAERAEAVRTLAEVVAGEPSFRVAGIAALAGGALIEMGAQPENFAWPLLARVPEVLVCARRFVDTVLTSAADDPPVETGVEIDAGRLVATARVHAALAADEPGGAAWYHLRHWCLPTVTLLSLSPLLRRELRGLLAPPADALASANGYARFLSILLAVFEDERILVVHPSAAFWVSVTGVADNFQLQTLLQGALAGLVTDCPAPDPRALASARGEGPQLSDVTVTGAWNLYDGRAMGLDLSDPEAVPRDLWVWGEGTPADIPALAGVRVLVLGPPSYARRWTGNRVFTHLAASVTVEARLDPAALARLASADA